MTNGQWQTEVLANLMYDWMFRGGGDSGRGSVSGLLYYDWCYPNSWLGTYTRHRARAEKYD